MHRKITRSLAALAALAGLVLASPAALAQSSRTWVSGTGDDNGICTRTAPCRTFAGAIAKTSPGGMISVLDPGAYGTLNITKAITIDGGGIANGGIISSAVTAVLVAAGVDDDVEIRNLAVYGYGNYSANGIRFVSGRSLTLANVEIHGFTEVAVEFAPSGDSSLTVVDSFIHHNYSEASPTTTGGIFVAPTGTGTATVNIVGSTLTDNGVGLRAYGRSLVSARGSVFSGNATYGVFAFGRRAGADPVVADYAVVTVSDSQLTGNGHRPESAGAAAYASGSLAEVTLSETDVTHNERDVRIADGAAVRSFGNNRIFDNDTTGAFTQTLSVR